METSRFISALKVKYTQNQQHASTYILDSALSSIRIQMNEMFTFCTKYQVPLSRALEAEFQDYSNTPIANIPGRVLQRQNLIAQMSLEDIDDLAVTLQVDVLENDKTVGLFKLPKNFSILRPYTLDDQRGVMGLG